MNKKIKLGFDARMIRHSGIGTYIRHMLNFLIQDEELDITLFGPTDKISEYSTQKVHAPYDIYSLKEQFYFPRVLNRVDLDCTYFPHYNVPLAYKGNIVVTIHDLIHLKYPPSKTAYFYARTMLEVACKKANWIIVTSNYTKEDLYHVLSVPKDKVTVVPTGPGIDFKTSNPPSANPRNPETKNPYILYVGNIKPSKNIQTLIEAALAVKKFIPEIRLVLAGKNSMPQLKEKYSDQPDILFLGEVSNPRLRELYRDAKLFVFPSLYEGFGLPPLEAMSFGIPVISSNATSLPEVLGNAAEFFSPQNTNALAEHIKTLWNSPLKRESLIQKGYENIKRFSWERCAREMANVFKDSVKSSC